MEDSTKHIHVKIEMENFATTYQEFETKFKKYVAIFKGSIDPITKINWCSDCVLIEEPIKNFFIPLAQEKNIAVLEVRCGQREDWIITHPLKVHKKIALKHLPTLAYITPGGVIKRLEEEQILDLELLKEFLDE